MHIFGKILLFMVIIGAATATAFTARMFDVRNSWMKAAEDLKQNNDENAIEIAKQEAELSSLRRELRLLSLKWGASIPDIAVADGASAQSITLRIGTSSGVASGQSRQPPGENPMLYVFRPADDGNGMVWVGPFTAQTVRDRETDIVPTWTVRAGEAQPWSSNQTGWRVWHRLPAGAVTGFGKRQQALIDADERLANRNNSLKIQNGLLDGAKKQNGIRREELLGPANPPALTADLTDMEYTHGLSVAIAAEEEARNKSQAEIDRLRREVKIAFEILEENEKKNRELIKQLPQPPKVAKQ
jgi:hypothetical protein